MTMFNIDEIKTTFMDSIRTYIYPQQLQHGSSISLLSEGTITQEFYPFTEEISACGIYISSVTGSPGGLTVEILHGNSTIASGTIPGTVGWNTLDNASYTELISARLSTIRITGDVSAGNDYAIGTGTLGDYFFGSTINAPIAFSIGVEDFVYKVFPMKELENNDLPLVVVDITGRPRIRDKYFSGDHVWMYVSLKCGVYSKYTKETDNLSYAIERGILKDRKNFSDVYYTVPGPLSEIAYINPEVYNRNFTWTLSQLIARE